MIGFSLKHSYSKVIHESLFQINKIDADYQILEINPEMFNISFDVIKLLDGFNVTIPYKTKIIDYLDDIDDFAKKLNSVNTVVNNKGRLKGYNTDYMGFLKSMLLHNIPLNLKTCLLGFGGTGKMIAKTLMLNNCDLTIAIRNISNLKKESIKSFMSINDKDIEIIDITEIAGKYDLLINATSSGMFPNVREMPIDESLLKNFKIVFDVVYNPSVTTLMRNALDFNCSVFNGEYMLMWQAIESQKIWLEGV